MQAVLEAWWHKTQHKGLFAKNYSEHIEIDSGHGRSETGICQQILVDKGWLGKEYCCSGLKNIINVRSENMKNRRVKIQQKHVAISPHWI
ncbi:MAG: ribosomal protein S26 [Psychromonas sp.]|jgi:ribosomal protein S26